MTKSLENWQQAIRESIVDSSEKVHEGIDMTSEYKIQQNKDRQAFEKWLLEVHLLEGTWNEDRNCYDEFACHLAFKAWCASKNNILWEMYEGIF